MSSTKDKIAGLEKAEPVKVKVNGEMKEFPPLSTHKYRKHPEWDKIKMELFSIINAYEPTVINNEQQVKEKCIAFIKGIIRNAQEQYDEVKDSGLSGNTILMEGYLKGCKDCLREVEEYL